MRKRVHILGLPHTVVNDDYMVCAFTAKLLMFPDILQPFGWEVVEYSNQGSLSRADRHVEILSAQEFQALSRRKSRDEPHDVDVNNEPLKQRFAAVLQEKIKALAEPGDIVCHVWGPDMAIYELLPQCHHLESSVGYTASPGLPFRVYETSAWMHWHYGKAGQENGSNYQWVVPAAFDTDKWAFLDQPDDYAVFLGRVTARKGIDVLLEIARRMPELALRVYGPGDTSSWAAACPPNLSFRGPVFGAERVEVVRRARCMLMPTTFIEPFGNAGVEAQLCGTPLIGSSYGAFQETVIDGVTGYRCNTLADWVEAIGRSAALERPVIARLARERYSKPVIGAQYDRIFGQLQALCGAGWYAQESPRFAQQQGA